MPKGKRRDGDDEFEDFLSPEEIHQWTEREIRNARKALELRVKELTEITTAYSAGKVTPEKADELYQRYQHRWGDRQV